MRYLCMGALCVVMIAGCGKQVSQEETVARVNDFTITKDRFETEFKDSSFSRIDTLDSRKEFLANLIDRKLILQYAQQKGLDREPGFLAAIEKFWEQSLLKITLDEKMKEITASVTVSDEEIQNAYDALVNKGGMVKAFDVMRFQIKNELQRTKESQAVNAWISELHAAGNITVKDELLQ